MRSRSRKRDETDVTDNKEQEATMAEVGKGADVSSPAPSRSLAEEETVKTDGPDR